MVISTTPPPPHGNDCKQTADQTTSIMIHASID